MFLDVRQEMCIRDSLIAPKIINSKLCIIGPTTKRPNIIAINNVKNGVTIKSITSGITFLSAFWVLAAIIPNTNAGNTEPWYPTTGIVKPNNDK